MVVPGRGELRQRLCDLLHQDVYIARPLVGVPASQQFVEEHRAAVDVGAVVNGLRAVRLLRGHVVRRPGRNPRLGQRFDPPPLHLEQLSEAVVDDLRLQHAQVLPALVLRSRNPQDSAEVVGVVVRGRPQIRWRHGEDVVGLDVPMQDPLLMSLADRREDIEHDAGGLFNRERPPQGEQLPHGQSLHELEDHEGQRVLALLAAVLSDVEEPGRAARGQLRANVPFAFEALQQVGLVDRRREEHLHRDVPLLLAVQPAVDHPKAADTDRCSNHVSLV